MVPANENITRYYIQKIMTANEVSQISLIIIYCQIKWKSVQYCVVAHVKFYLILISTGFQRVPRAAPCKDRVRQTCDQEGVLLQDTGNIQHDVILRN